MVAADEILDVQYEFRSRPVGTAEAKFVISGVERTFRLIPQPFANRANLSGERYIFYNTNPYINGKNASGGNVRDGQWQKKYPKYVRGSYKAQITLLAQVQNGNMAGGITGTEELQIYNGRNYVLDINPPVVKNNTQEFSVTLEFTVARA
uniref:Tail fiber protein n=1 Tax=Pseudomonas phage vB_PaPhi_Mx1 TaxID=3079664 RepID=A0AAU0N5J3_9CAUD